MSVNAENPIVSVVTVVLNGEDYLEEMILSVKSQTYPRLEFIVVDGGSSDSTPMILAKYKSLVDLVICEPDDGIYDAMDKGIRKASGNIIKLLNSDDVLTEGSVELAVAQFGQVSSATNAIVRSSLVVIDAKGEELKIWGKSKKGKKHVPVLHPSWYVSREVYDNHGLHDLTYRIAADYEIYLRFLAAGVEFRTMNIPLVKYRIGGASSGFRGLRETFAINVNYEGILYAFYEMMLRTALKVFGKMKFGLFAVLPRSKKS